MIIWLQGCDGKQYGERAAFKKYVGPLKTGLSLQTGDISISVGNSDSVRALYDNSAPVFVRIKLFFFSE